MYEEFNESGFSEAELLETQAILESVVAEADRAFLLNTDVHPAQTFKTAVENYNRQNYRFNIELSIDTESDEEVNFNVKFVRRKLN